MCNLVLSFKDEPDDRRVKVPHAAIKRATQLLDNLGAGWWPTSQVWPTAIKFDLWSGTPPLLVNGEFLKAVTVDICDDYLKSRG